MKAVILPLVNVLVDMSMRKLKKIMKRLMQLMVFIKLQLALKQLLNYK